MKMTSLITMNVIAAVLTAGSLMATSQEYTGFGSPTAAEQWSLTYVNRARANPTEEGARLSLLGSGGKGGATGLANVSWDQVLPFWEFEYKKIEGTMSSGFFEPIPGFFSYLIDFEKVKARFAGGYPAQPPMINIGAAQTQMRAYTALQGTYPVGDAGDEGEHAPFNFTNPPDFTLKTRNYGDGAGETAGLLNHFELDLGNYLPGHRINLLSLPTYAGPDRWRPYDPSSIPAGQIWQDVMDAYLANSANFGVALSTHPQYAALAAADPARALASSPIHLSTGFGFAFQPGIDVAALGGSAGYASAGAMSDTGLRYFVTGVVYRDQNHDDCYSVGEGIAGLRVESPQLPSWHTFTAAEGGYALPLDDVRDWRTSVGRTITLTFSGAGLSAPLTREFVIRLDERWEEPRLEHRLRSIRNELIDVRVPGDPISRPINLSTRVFVGNQDDVAILGAIFRNGYANLEERHRYLVRVIGPSLSQFGVPNVLVDPTVDVYVAGQPVRTIDNWQTDPAVAAAVSATGLAPADPREAAYVFETGIGSATFVVRGKDGTVGNALVELYDLDGANPNWSGMRLANISTRGKVGSGDNALIAGFVVGGGPDNKPRRVMVDLFYLDNADVAGPINLNVPKLATGRARVKVFASGAQSPLAVIDDYAAMSADAKDARRRRIFGAAFGYTNAGLERTSCADVVSLPPGAYTAVVEGVAGATGVALIEIHDETFFQERTADNIKIW